MIDIYKKVSESVSFIKQKFKHSSTFAIVTGSGLDGLLDEYDTVESIKYSDIPHLKAPTFHKGEVLLLKKGDNYIYALKGRLHYYEGFSVQEITYPIRILDLLGVEKIIMTNASGGLNPKFNAGEIMLVRDHINLFPENPLRGPNDERFGIRFPDMSNAYDEELRQHIKAHVKFHLNEGVYVGFPGPSLETPAEYKYLNIIGGDAVGMSTVPEVIVANHCNMKVVVLSVTTNICYPPESINETTLEEVLEMANKAVPKLNEIIDVILLN